MPPKTSSENQCSFRVLERLIKFGASNLQCRSKEKGERVTGSDSSTGNKWAELEIIQVSLPVCPFASISEPIAVSFWLCSVLYSRIAGVTLRVRTPNEN